MSYQPGYYLRNAIKYYKTTLILAILLGLLTSSSQAVLAQSPITAQAEPTRLTLDEQVTLTITVSGDFLNIPNPDLSQLENFVIVSSSTSTQVSIVNGKMSSQKIFVFQLQPLQEGTLTIGTVSVNVDGQRYQTDPIEIEVIGGGAPVPTPEEDAPDIEAPDSLNDQEFWIEAEVDNPNPYLGEQIIYTFRLYQATNFFGQPDYEPPSFTDFWSSEILAQPHFETETDGRRYLVTEIRTALFPANLGSITIEPATLVIPGGVFNPDIKLETNPVQVEIKPLPDDAPDDFSGAVGQYNIEASLSETEVKVNEPVNLTIEIAGTGNIQNITEPELPELTNWRVFESQTSTTTENNEDEIRGRRTYERLVVPSRPGEQTFPAINFSYFDPQTEAYQTISSDPIPLTVLPDDSASAPPLIVDTDDNNRIPVELIGADIRHIKPVPASLNSTSQWSPVIWSIFGCFWAMPLLVAGGVFVWHRRYQRLQEDTAYARDQRAQRAALQILTQTRQTGGNPADGAGRAILGYLSDKLNKPTVGLTTDNLIKLLHDHNLDPALVSRVRALLDQVDVGRFAPVSEGAGRSMLDDTQQLIKDIEKSLGKKR